MSRLWIGLCIFLLNGESIRAPLHGISTRVCNIDLVTFRLKWSRGQRPGIPDRRGHRRQLYPYAKGKSKRDQKAPKYSGNIGQKKKRLDELCLERYPHYSRNVIQSWITQGKVLVNDVPATKAGMAVSKDATIRITAEVPKYVCRAGIKLERAIEYFELNVTGRVVLDSGLSTGGFTDCLLQNGAERVYGVDVGYGQVAEKIRTDDRVVVLERTNLKSLTSEMLEGQRPNLATLDLSFISVVKVLPTIIPLLSPDAEIVILIKPQFEATKQQVGSGGVVRDPEVHKEVISNVINALEGYGFDCKGYTESPIKGATGGNTEFLAAFTRRINTNSSSLLPTGEYDDAI